MTTPQTAPTIRRHVTASPDIDSAIARLDEALRASGLPGLEPPGDVAAAEEVADVVAPYSLPTELRRFWERVDPEGIQVFTFPMLRGPATALDLVRGLRELDVTVPLVPPPVLLPFDYASHCYAVIELGSEWCEGGTLFEWEFDNVPLVSRSLADRIDMVAELLLEDRFERGDGYVSLDHRAEQEKRLEGLSASSPDPVYGDLRTIPSDPQSWPPHWLAASSIDLRTREPLGATHTIAELIVSAGGGRATGRIHGTVTNLAGGGDGSLIVVDDGTMSLEVWCPAGTSLWGPVHRTRQEVEVAIEGPVGAPADLATPHAEVTMQALAGNLEAAQDAALALFDVLNAHRAAAVATDIRPLD